MEPAAGCIAVSDFGTIIRATDAGPGREPVERGPVPWYVEEGRKVKLRAVLRRRWLLSTLLLLAVVGAASLVSYLTPAKYSAEAVLVVPAVTVNTPAPGNPDAAAKLAKTYAALIPLNSALIQQTSSKAHVDPVYLAANISATNDAGTGIVRLTYVGTDKMSAATVPTVMAVILTGLKPPTPVAAGSLRLITAPRSVIRSGGDLTQGLVLGTVLGLVVAFAVAFALERTNPHVDGPTEVAETVRVPVTTWNAPTPLGVTRLLRSWDTGTLGRSWQVALIPVGDVGRPRMRDLVCAVTALHRAATESGPAGGNALPAGSGHGSNPVHGVADGSAAVVVNGVANGSAAGVVNGVANGGAAGVVNGVANGGAAGVVNGVANGGAAGVVNGVANGGAAGLADGVANGSAAGLADGVTHGSSVGSTRGAGSGAGKPSVPPRIQVVDLLAGDDAQKLESADTIVLVVAPGVSASTLGSTARRLRNQGAAPAWSIFVPGRSAEPGKGKGKGKGAVAGVVRHADL